MKLKSLHIILCLLIFYLCGCDGNLYSKDWQEADIKWDNFSKEYLKKRHQEEAQTVAGQNDPEGFKTVFEELKSSLLRKYFPDYKFFREQLAGAQVLGAYALSKKGDIIDISDGWRFKSSGPTNPKEDMLWMPAGSYNVKFADFIRAQKIKINNEKEASEFNKLTDMIMYKWSVRWKKYSASKEDRYWDGNTSAHCSRRMLVVDTDSVIQDIFASSCMNVKGAVDEYFTDNTEK